MTQEVIRHQCTVHGLALKVTCLNNERTRGHFVTFARFARSVTFWVPMLNCKQYSNPPETFPFQVEKIYLTWNNYMSNGLVSSTFQIAQILVQPHFELISLVLALEATEPLSEPVVELAVELITIISFQYSKRDECKSYILFHVKTTTNRF